MAKSKRGWLLSARTSGAIAWFLASDPLGDWSAPIYGSEPKLSAPHTMFRCADGVLRLFAGDRAASPQEYDRDPLYPPVTAADKQASGLYFVRLRYAEAVLPAWRFAE